MKKNVPSRLIIALVLLKLKRQVILLLDHTAASLLNRPTQKFSEFLSILQNTSSLLQPGVKLFTALC